MSIVDEELMDTYMLNKSKHYLSNAAYQSLTIKRTEQELNDITTGDL